jgi:hypothetical protein
LTTIDTDSMSMPVTVHEKGGPQDPAVTACRHIGADENAILLFLELVDDARTLVDRQITD